MPVTGRKNKLLCGIFGSNTGNDKRTAGRYVTDGQLHILYCMTSLQIIFGYVFVIDVFGALLETRSLGGCSVFITVY